MMTESIGMIKEKFQAAAIEELPALFQQYGRDERAGVQAAVEKGRKRIAAYEREIARCEELKRYEREYSAYAYICGIDEVGRGPLVGPVVTACVILPEDFKLEGLTDSKKLSEKKRDVILLSYFMDMSDAEIARKMNLVRSTVHEHRTRSLELMKKIMEDQIG